VPTYEATERVWREYRRLTAHSQHTARARQEIILADRYLDTSIDSSDPAEWAKLAQRAATLCDKVHRNVRLQAAIDRRIAQTQKAQRHPGVDNVFTPRGPSAESVARPKPKAGTTGASADPSIRRA
jgi:hypothetical protein